MVFSAGMVVNSSMFKGILECVYYSPEMASPAGPAVKLEPGSLPLGSRQRHQSRLLPGIRRQLLEDTGLQVCSFHTSSVFSIVMLTPPPPGPVCGVR